MKDAHGAQDSIKRLIEALITIGRLVKTGAAKFDACAVNPGTHHPAAVFFLQPSTVVKPSLLRQAVLRHSGRTKDENSIRFSLVGTNPAPDVLLICTAF